MSLISQLVSVSCIEAIRKMDAGIVAFVLVVELCGMGTCNLRVSDINSGRITNFDGYLHWKYVGEACLPGRVSGQGCGEESALTLTDRDWTGTSSKGDWIVIGPGASI